MPSLVSAVYKRETILSRYNELQARRKGLNSFFAEKICLSFTILMMLTKKIRPIDMLVTALKTKTTLRRKTQ
jgi:hypothetical protein